MRGGSGDLASSLEVRIPLHAKESYSQQGMIQNGHRQKSPRVNRNTHENGNKNGQNKTAKTAAQYLEKGLAHTSHAQADARLVQLLSDSPLCRVP